MPPLPVATFFYEYPLASIYYHHPKLPISGELLTPLFIRSPYHERRKSTTYEFILIFTMLGTQIWIICCCYIIENEIATGSWVKLKKGVERIFSRSFPDKIYRQYRMKRQNYSTVIQPWTLITSMMWMFAFYSRK